MAGPSGRRNARGVARLVPVALLCVVLAACGSTVQVSGGTQVAGGADATDEVGLSPEEAVGGQGGPEAVGESGLDAGGATRQTVRQGAGAGVQTGSGAKPNAVAATGPVRVGLLYLDGAEAAASALGISGLTTGDTAAQAAALVKHVNSRGGLGGRPIDLRMGRMSASRIVADPDGTHAAACASLTEDQKVAFVVSYVQLTSGQLACYAKRGVTVLDDQSSVPDGAGAEQANVFASPGELALGRATNELVDALWRTGWLTSGSKVGTIVYDTPDGVGIETKYLRPALARHGLTPAATSRTSASADGANQSGTVLQFRSAGVDRIIPIGASPLFLMNAAESQGYRPSYAMTSTFGPGALLESAAPRAQLHNAAGIGWSKYLDIGAGTMPGPVSANETLCFQIMRDSGQQTTSATVQAFQAALCNVFLFLDATTDKFGLTPGLLARVRSAAFDFPPADAFAIRLVPGRADGVAAYRDVVFDDGCNCFQYTSGNRATR